MKLIDTSLIIYRIFIFLSFICFSEISRADDSWCPNRSFDALEKEYAIKNALKFKDDIPSALEKLKTEGLLPGQGIYDQSKKSKEDFKKIEALALGWKLTKNLEFLISAENFILNWVHRYKPNGNPIDETDFTILFNSFAIISPNIDEDKRKIINDWILNFFNIYADELHRLKQSSRPQISNWQSHRIKIALTAAAVTKSINLVNEIEPYFHSQVSNNINADGSTIDFHQRDSIGYSIYSLRPMLETALTVKSLKKDWLPIGSISRKKMFSAINWFKPYLNESIVHTEFVNTTVRFDKIRSDAGLPGHLREAWKPSNAKTLLWLAAYLDNDYLTMARSISSKPPRYLSICHGII